MTPSLLSAARSLQNGALSSAALTESCLSAIARENGRLKAFTFVDAAGARYAAAAADARRAQGASLGPLDGIPVAVKSNIAVTNWPHTAGLKFRRDVFASEDAFAVARLRAAGAVLLGATNMDEGALGASGINPWYGNTQNPWRDGYSPGGSSSGSACAVAAGLCIYALGTDTIGSLRIPASFCGCVGLKPSSGWVSLGGVVPVNPRFDHVGPLVRDPGDLRPVMQVLAGWDPHSPTSFPVEPRPARPAELVRNIGFGVGIERDAIDADVIKAYNKGIAAFRAMGAQLVPIDLRHWDLTRVRRAILALCEAEMWRSHREQMTASPSDYSDSLRAFIRFGARLTPEDLMRAEARLTGFRTEWLAQTAPFDAVILPTAACAAFPFGERHPDNTAEFTAIATAAGLPALSVPLPVAGDALPVGLQMIGQAGGDLDLIALATRYVAAAGTAAA